MASVLDGIEVLDLSCGIAGPMTGMLLSDLGARVTKIESPGRDPFGELSGSRVWLRGKRRATVDLTTDEGRGTILALAKTADVLIDSWSPGAAKLGLDYETLAAGNPRLVHCSITGYGEWGKDREPAGLRRARCRAHRSAMGVAGDRGRHTRPALLQPGHAWL